ncbi:hypothetical protein MAR_001432 [Mya arenaria]|uniref:B box-type domain-containing protein n=1 Tax=Mya arenaria TaxID=6604 RepID=A0ABY7FFG2_MYAAR|nr:hypothetical protein MAR_001432 [Mya arenaria]
MSKTSRSFEQIHEDKFKEYYCFHHRDLFCPDCIISKHTNTPCYARNCQDAVSDVKKHVADLLGQLRLQEEHAVRIGSSKVAAAHSDDLLQKVWEVEHLIDRFHKQMKKKLNESHDPAADQSDEKIGGGQGEVDQHQDQVDHFQTVLTAVEKRPFCVNVQADEQFLELISLNQEPVVVQNQSATWTPLNPTTANRVPSVDSFKSRPSQRDRKSVPHFKKSLGQLSPRTNDNDTSLPRTRSSYRTVPVPSKPLPSESSSPRHQQQHPPSRQQRIQEKNPTILPRLTAGGLTSGETSKVFNIRSLKLKGISQQSIFELPCEDIIVMDSNIITLTERAVQKFSLRYQFLQSMELRAPLRLCYTRDDTGYVLVLDNSNGISLVSTHPRLQLLEDCVDVMVVTYEKRAVTLGLIEEITLKPAKVKTICGSNDDACLKNMNAICTAPENRKILIGAQSGVVCLSRDGDIIWSYQTSHSVCSVDSRRGLIYAVVEKEKRVFILDQHGNSMVDTIFPTGCTVTRPSRVSVGKTSLIVREFVDNDQHGLKSMVHVFNLSF